MSRSCLLKVKDYFDETAGIPPPTVWLWGTQSSLLAYGIAWVFFYARCVSPLQHCKQRYRTRKRRAKASDDAEGYDDRLDVEARYTEIYFLGALAFIAVLGCITYLTTSAATVILTAHCISLYFEPLHLPVIIVADIASGFLAVESFFWISYYLLWRSFAEPVYTLYHPAEYFVLFPVVLLVQTISLAILLSVGPFHIFLALVDVAEKPEAIVALGKFYFIVIIANLLSMFPQTRFKTPTVVNLIGAGDVVAKRMLAALLKGPNKMTAAHIQVFSLGGGDEVSDAIEAQDVKLHLMPNDMAARDAEDRIIAKVIASGAPAIIATPSFAHFRYVTALNSKGIRFAVEKPLSILPQEIKVFTEVGDQFKERMFALSYYGLEKALPLTYLLTANHHYERFLTIEGDGAVAGKPVSLHFDAPILLSMMGRLKSVRIDLIEGPEIERRVWTEQQGAQGIAFETMIHPLILLQKFIRHQGLHLCDFQPSVTAGHSADAHSPNSTTFLRYDGVIETQYQTVEVVLTCGKYADEANRRRAGVAEFEAGHLDFDFDIKRCDITLHNGRNTSVGLLQPFAMNYAVQMALVRQFFKDGWIDLRFDDFDDEIEVLNWLLNIGEASSHSFTYGKSDFVQLARYLKLPAATPHP